MEKTAKKDLVFRKTQKTALKRRFFGWGMLRYQQADQNQSCGTLGAFKRILSGMVHLILSLMGSFCMRMPQKLAKTKQRKDMAQALFSKAFEKASKIAFSVQTRVFLWFCQLKPFLGHARAIPADFRRPIADQILIREPFPFPFSTQHHARYCHS